MAGSSEASVGAAGILRRSERGVAVAALSTAAARAVACGGDQMRRRPGRRPRAEEMSTRTLIVLAALCAVAILAASAAQILLAR